MSAVVNQDKRHPRKQVAGITVRRPKLSLHSIPRYYFGHSPVTSHLLTALSATFPIGEQFFVHSVRNVRDRIVGNDKLQAEISAFIGQEAMHSHAHADFNNSWRRDDYQLDSFMAWLAREDARAKSLPPKVQLAVTCAFEHFTAMLGEYVLRHPELVDSFDKEAARLWLWHAVEELEHRSVAFDTYEAVFHDAKTRRTAMRYVTTGFASLTFYSFSRLFWQDRRHSLPKIRANAVGIFRLARMLVALTPEYLAYFREDFHPNEKNVDRLLAKWRARLGSEQYHVEGFVPDPATPVIQ